MGDKLTIHSETPEVTTLSMGRLFVTRWHVPPHAVAFARVSGDVERITREQRNVCYVGISDEHSGTPDEPTQKLLVSTALGILRRVEAMHLVVEGDSLKSSLSRTLFRGMIMAAKLGNKVVGFEVGELANKVTLRDSTEALLKLLPDALGCSRGDVAGAFDRARAHPQP
ncbi:MAG: hypothetical protein U0414_37820 [Polyangiaceae bacterium]